MKKFYCILPLLILCLFMMASDSFGVPQFAAKTGQRCGFCHVNPTGCWMRNMYGAQFFAQTEMPAHKIAQEQIAKFTPMISDNISLGADLRMLYNYNKDRKTSMFFQMEGNFYVNAQLSDKFSLAYYTDPTLNFVTSYQAWGMANVLPSQGYIRAGRFQPTYGWRFADHSSFVRDSLGWTPSYSDAGVEMGIYPNDISFNLGLFNGIDSPLETNQGKSLAARFEIRQKFGSAGAALGGSFWRNDLDSNSVSLFGPFYYLSLLDGRISYIGEIDWRKRIHSDIKAMAMTHNLHFVLIQGVWLGASYDFIDQDTKHKTGSTSRFGVGLDIFPIAFAEIEPVVRYYSYDNGPGIAKTHNTDFHTEFHFFF